MAKSLTWEQLYERIRQMPVRDRIEPVRLCTMNESGPVQIDETFVLTDVVEKPNKLRHPVGTIAQENWER